MSIGMSYEQYWYGDADPDILRQYIEADKLRQQRMNGEAWWYGMYNYNALAVALGNAFREKGKPAESYPKEPYEIGEKSEPEQEKQEEQEALYAMAYMSNMVQMGKGWGKK